MSTMFVWKSEAVENYMLGTVAVIAENEDEAREKARAALIDYAKTDRHSYWFGAEGKVYPDCTDDWKGFMRKVNIDLRKKPKTMSALVVPGSD
jgi:hypothetical protein